MKIETQRFREYARMPAMRQFWVLTGFLLILLVIGLVYLPATLKIASLVIVLVALVITFLNSKRTAKANYELKLEKQLLGTVIESLQDAVVVYDGEFRIMEFTQSAERLFNLKAEEVVGKPLQLEVATKEPRLRVLGQILFPSLAPTMVERSEPGQEPQVTDVMIEDPYLELRVITAHIKNQEGEITGFIKIIRDRTREVQLLKSKNDFITVASHQLRTPLTAIQWAFQESLKTDVSAGDLHTLLDTGAKASAKMSKIVEEFLNIAKIEEGRFGYEYVDTDLVAFIEKVVEEATLIAKQYKVGVYFDRPKGEVRAPIDVQKMGIVFSNIIDNAIKYNVEDGRVNVWVRALPGQPYAEVMIEDTGVGIPPEDITKVFTKFYRGQNTMTKETEGSGLGLYLAKNIVQQHGGKMWAESTMGRGTKIFFTLPTDIQYIPQKELPREGATQF